MGKLRPIQGMEWLWWQEHNLGQFLGAALQETGGRGLYLGVGTPPCRTPRAMGGPGRMAPAVGCRGCSSHNHKLWRPFSKPHLGDSFWDCPLSSSWSGSLTSDPVPPLGWAGEGGGDCSVSGTVLVRARCGCPQPARLTFLTLSGINLFGDS